MKNLINFHIHSTGSDGKLSPKEIVKKAIKSEIKYLCFTDHYPFPPGFSKKKNSYFPEGYKEEVNRIKEKYKNEISISFGAEINYIEGYENWFKKEIKRMNLDYTIGSIHFIANGKEFWLESAKKLGGIKKFIGQYYKQLRMMVKSKIFNCVGHFDLIKIYNKNFILFSEDEEWYKKEVLETLDEVKKAGMCIEINTSGWIREVGIQYPSKWILEETKKRNISITIGNDFHGRNDRYKKINEKIDTNLGKAFNLAKEMGYNAVVIFKNRKQIKLREL